MISFGNPSAFWLLFLFLPITVLGFWGWMAKKRDILSLLFMDILKAQRVQLMKYAIFIMLVGLLIVVLAQPRIASPVLYTNQKTGEILFLVDVSGSMAARKDIDGPSRLERTRE